jgi:hypothetical protein
MRGLQDDETFFISEPFKKLWGTTSNSNIEILERFQSKVLRLIVDAPWYVSNSVTRNDLQIPAVK